MRSGGTRSVIAAMWHSLVASCEARGVNPEEYPTDVLLRVQTRPARRVKEVVAAPVGAGERVAHGGGKRATSELGRLRLCRKPLRDPASESARTHRSERVPKGVQESPAITQADP